MKSFRKISKLWSDYAINSIPGIEKKLPWNAVACAHEYTYFYILFILDDADQELSVRLKWICRHNNNTSTDHRPYKHNTDLICSLFLLIFPLFIFCNNKKYAYHIWIVCAVRVHHHCHLPQSTFVFFDSSELSAFTAMPSFFHFVCEKNDCDVCVFCLLSASSIPQAPCL